MEKRREAIVEVTGLAKSYNGLKAVDDISFKMYPGEILGLLGPNGAGKTTTIQMLLGLTIPDDGDITILGKALAEEREEILKDVNFSASYINMPYSLTVAENLTVFGRLYGLRNPGPKIEELLTTFEVLDIKNRVTRGLSSGQMTRVGLAKALINDPKIVLLDEPTANLDPDIADKTRMLLKKLKEERGLSILYTSHNMREMELLSDRVMLMDQGKILFTGRIEKLLEEFREKSLEEVFLKVARDQ